MKNINEIFKIGILCLGLFFLIIVNKYVNQNKYHFEDNMAINRLNGEVYHYEFPLGWYEDIEDLNTMTKEFKKHKEDTDSYDFKKYFLP